MHACIFEPAAKRSRRRFFGILRFLQDNTQTLWDPTLGSPGHPGSGKIQLVKFSPLSSQICLAKLPKPPWDHLVRPQTRLRGGPCKQPSAWMPPTVSHDATQSLWGPTMGSPRHSGSGKIEKTTNYTHFGVPKKNTSQKPQKRRNS